LNKSEILDSAPPSSLENERAVIAAIILDRDGASEVFELLTLEDFYDAANRTIYWQLNEMRRRGIGIDMVTLTHRLRDDGQYDSIGGAAHLAQLTRSAPVVTHATFYAQIVKEVSAKRRLRHLAERLLCESANGKAPEQSITDALATLDSIKAGTAAIGPQPIPFGDLAEDFPKMRPVVVEGLLRQTETANIVSASKVGKSWMLYDLLLCIVMGWKFLDRFQCTRSRVLLIDYELHRPSLVHRFQSVGEAKGIKPEQYRLDVDVLSLRGHLLDLHKVLELLRAVEPGTYGAIACDTLSRSYPEGLNENDNNPMIGLYNEIDAAVERLGCAWINVHHSSKGNQSEKRVTDVGAGAGAQSRCPDAHIIFREHEEPNAVVLDAALRSFAPIEPVVLRWQFPLWTPDDSLDPGKLKGKLTASEQRQSTRDSEGVTLLAAALAQGAASVKVLRGRSGLSKDRAERLLDMLEAQGNVRWTEEKIRGNTCRMYESVNLDAIDEVTNDTF
jgi:hypothetical protein